MTAQDMLWTISGVAIATALVAGFAEWRRSSRSDLNKVGWVPWTFIQVMALLTAMAAAALALNG